MMRQYDGTAYEDARSVSTARKLRANWLAMDAPSRRVWEDKARALFEYLERYEACQVKAGAQHAPLLRALLARSPSVHTLRLDGPDSIWDTRHYKPKLVLTPADGLLRQIGAAWGAQLRVMHLGVTQLAVQHMHALLAACPLLAWLHAGDVRIVKDGDAPVDAAKLFVDMAPHASLTAVALPSTAQKHLAAYVNSLCVRCPALREINAERFDASDYGTSDVLAACARAAAARGVRRFLCTSFFANGGSDGEYGSDGGSVGEYCGDGNVLKYL
jgi:hypothetical protein